MNKVKPGLRVGRGVVLKDSGNRTNRNREVLWLCQCDCGNAYLANTSNLRTGHTKSCGCLSKEVSAEAMRLMSTKHGFRKSYDTHPLYKTWRSMRARCLTPSAPSYHRYGGRGIKICSEWEDPVNFINWAIAHGWQKELTLDRIDNDGNYEPDNCRWVTAREQAWNRGNNTWIIWQGERRLLIELAKEYRINYNTLRHRITSSHWPIERALTTPVKERKHAS